MADVRHVQVGATTRAVTRHADGRLEVESATWSAEPAGPGCWRLWTADATARVWVAGPPDAPWVFFNGRVYRPEVTDGPVRPRLQREDAGSLTAPMPATVRAVLVKAGDTVTTGQTLIVLEAMKMELPLRAPGPGAVVRVACAPGDMVQPGTTLVEIG